MSGKIRINSRYGGPRQLREDVEVALVTVAHHLSLQLSECETHSVLVVQNFDEREVLEATAIYLVAALAQCIEGNLQIREALFDEADMSRDLERDVISIIGKHGVNNEFKKMVRDPWIWEGISHMLIHLARLDPNFHPSGRVLVKTSLKHDVHDHGLDVIAIYEATNLGLSAGECKAYFEDPSRGITDASNKLSEVDKNIRDIEIRSAVSQLRSALNDEAKGKLAGAFWRDERSYLPFVCCDSEHVCSWTRKRKPLQQLAIPVSRKILIPLPLLGAREKFDTICDTMRAYVAI